jgi:diaminopimelate decarboxylase
MAGIGAMSVLPEPVRAALLALPEPRCAYVYDTAALRTAATALRSALPPRATVLYAVKANSHPDVVATLAGSLDGLEVASGGELELAVATGAATIAFGGPAKTDIELRAAVDAGALVHVESVLELRRLGLAAEAAGRRVRAALRVNRADGALPGTRQMTGAPTPFGIDDASLGEAAALAATLPGVELIGFHLHAVSNNLDAAAHASFVAEAVRWAVKASLVYGVPLSYLNVGGGFGVDYAGPGGFDLAVFAAALPEAVAALPSGVQLVFEPGRFLAANAGWYAAQVLDLKHTHGRWFAVLRGGTHHFRLPAAWDYSHPFTVLPIEEWPYPFARPQVCDVPVDAVGELCTPRDVLTRGQQVDRLRVGDVLMFARTGAYAWDISHHEFLRHPHPTFVVI